MTDITTGSAFMTAPILLGEDQKVCVFETRRHMFAAWYL